MRGFSLLITAVLVTATGWAADVDKPSDKPYPVFTPANFTTNMQLMGRNFGGVNASLAKKDYEAAKGQLVRSRELLMITITFWRNNKKDDAVKILRDTVTKMDALDDALSAENVDQAAATAIAKDIAAGCQSCHTLYREQDPNTKAFRVKQGLLQQ
jgi:hypothetical protein